MSTHRRRYGIDQIVSFKYNRIKRENEISLYSLISDPNDQDISFFINDHVDYIILYIIIFFKKKYIDERTCNKLIDMVEGYYFSYESELLSSKKVFQKLNTEIMQDWLNQDFNYLAVRRC